MFYSSYTTASVLCVYSYVCGMSPKRVPVITYMAAAISNCSLSVSGDKRKNYNLLARSQYRYPPLPEICPAAKVTDLPLTGHTLNEC